MQYVYLPGPTWVEGTHDWTPPCRVGWRGGRCRFGGLGAGGAYSCPPRSMPSSSTRSRGALVYSSSAAAAVVGGGKRRWEWEAGLGRAARAGRSGAAKGLMAAAALRDAQPAANIV